MYYCYVEVFRNFAGYIQNYAYSFEIAEFKGVLNLHEYIRSLKNT